MIIIIVLSEYASTDIGLVMILCTSLVLVLSITMADRLSSIVCLPWMGNDATSGTPIRVKSAHPSLMSGTLCNNGGSWLPWQYL